MERRSVVWVCLPTNILGLFTGACLGNTKWVCLPVLLWAIQNRPVYRRVFVSVYRRLCGQYKMGLLAGASVGNTK